MADLDDGKRKSKKIKPSVLTAAPGVVNTWLRLATERSVIRRAASLAVVVGSLLVAINHGDALLRGDISMGRVLRIFLTVAVPYCVSTYSSIAALRDRVNGDIAKRSGV